MEENNMANILFSILLTIVGIIVLVLIVKKNKRNNLINE